MSLRLVIPGVETRPIPDFPGYWITEYGDVYSLKSGRIKRLKPYLSKSNGYRVIGLRANRVGVKFFVHRLVLTAFVGLCPEGQLGRHLDDDRLNNHISNLAWGTQKQNIQDAIRNGKIKMGSKHYNAIISDEQALEIIRRLQSCQYSADISRIMGISESIVYGIRAKNTWRHLTDDIDFPDILDGHAGERNPSALLTDESVKEIKKRLEYGLDTYKKIADDFGVTDVTISNIKRGITWKHVK